MSSLLEPSAVSIPLVPVSAALVAVSVALVAVSVALASEVLGGSSVVDPLDSLSAPDGAFVPPHAATAATRARQIGEGAVFVFIVGADPG